MKKLILQLTIFVFASVALAQEKPDSLKDVGVAVTPSHLNYNLKAGESKTQEVKITNETKIKRSFRITLKDFDMNNAGKPVFMDAGKSEHSISRWLSVSPTLVELQPGASAKIRMTLNLPDSDGVNRAAWCIALIEEVKDRESLEPEGGDKKISLGIIPSVGFGVYIYQNPPNVAINKVEIKNFKLQGADKAHRAIELTLSNTGDGIASCSAYIELTNSRTGKSQRLMVKRFTILPGYTRNYLYQLPENLDKGKYSAVGVLDFGSKDEVEAAELEFLIE